MAQLKKLVTSKIIDMLRKLAKEEAEAYEKFWKGYDRFIKQGVAIEQNEPEALYPLLRFHTTEHPERWSSLDEYVDRMKPEQEKIYYLLADDERSAIHSPHLDIVRRYDYETLLLTDPLDAFMLVRLKEYREHALENVATADLKLPEGEEKEGAPEAVPESESAALVERFKQQLGERVTDVRMTDRLSGSPARLVDPEGSLNQEMQRVYRLLNREYEVPKKVLELNPSHPILVRLSQLGAEDERNALVIEQVYEDALLIEGLHPDPASMIERIQQLMEEALGKSE